MSDTTHMLHTLIQEQSFRLLSGVSAVSVADAEGRVVYANPLFLKLFGIDAVDLAARQPPLLHPLTAQPALWQQVQTGVAWRGEISGQTTDGTAYWTDSQIVPVKSPEGQVVGLLTLCNDITPMKQAQAEAELLNTRLTALIESIPDAIFFKDGDSRWLITNETAKQAFRLHGVDWVGKTELELAEIQPEFRTAHEVCLEDDEKAWRAGTLSFFTEFVADAQGHLREYEVRKMPVFNPDGSRKALVIIGTDITARKQQEAALHDTRKILEQTTRIARIGGWEVDFITQTVHWSGLTRELAEVDDDFVPTMENILDFYKAGESRSKIVAAVDEAMQTGVGFDLVLELVSARGREHWVRVIAEPQLINGQYTRIIGSFQDITEQIALDQKSKHIELKFSRLIEKSENAVILQDASGFILYASPAIERVLGYTRDAIVGRNTLDVFHPDDVPNVMARRQEVLDNPGKTLPIAVGRLRHQDGHYVSIEGAVTNLLHDESVRALVGNIRDVTERKQFEEKLKAKNAALEKIAWMFSHGVRGPIATLLGLVSLFNHGDKADPINEMILNKILTPLHQLDEVIAEIVWKTDELDTDS